MAIEPVVFCQSIATFTQACVVRRCVEVLSANIVFIGTVGVRGAVGLGCSVFRVAGAGSVWGADSYGAGAVGVGFALDAAVVAQVAGGCVCSGTYLAGGAAVIVVVTGGAGSGVAPFVCVTVVVFFAGDALGSVVGAERRGRGAGDT